jgi:hypothetical protein
VGRFHYGTFCTRRLLFNLEWAWSCCRHVAGIQTKGLACCTILTRDCQADSCWCRRMIIFLLWASAGEMGLGRIFPSARVTDFPCWPFCPMSHHCFLRPSFQKMLNSSSGIGGQLKVGHWLLSSFSCRHCFCSLLTDDLFFIDPVPTIFRHGCVVPSHTNIKCTIIQDMDGI